MLESWAVAGFSDLSSGWMIFARALPSSTLGGGETAGSEYCMWLRIKGPKFFRPLILNFVSAKEGNSLELNRIFASMQ